MLDTVLEKEKTSIICINPFPPSVPMYMATFSKTFDFNFRRDHQKNFL